MTADVDVKTTRFRFAATDGTVWLGLRPVPLAAVGVSLCLTVAGLYLGAPLPLAAAVLAAGALLGFVPVAGRMGIDWTAPLTRHTAAVATARRSWSAGVPAVFTGGHRAPPVAARLPREYGRLRVLAVSDAALGVIDDPDARTMTAVLAVAGTDRFALLDATEQASRLAAWGNALAALAADPEIHRVQWIERAGPDRRDPASWLRERAADADTDARAVSDYTEMAGRLGDAALRHEIWIAIGFGRRGIVRGSESAVADRVRDVAGTLLAADLLARPLTSTDITGLLRQFADHDVAEPPAGQGWPASRRIAWDHLRTDDTWHRSFAITSWPRIPVSAGWLEPLLATASPTAVRTLSLHLEPVAPAVATREARAARTRARLDGADRGRLGFTETTATAWAEADAAGTEEELLAGYQLHRVSGIVTCSAAGITDLDEACRAVRTAATGARVGLRPLHGHHDLGFLASLPLCRTKGLAR